MHESRKNKGLIVEDDMIIISNNDEIPDNSNINGNNVYDYGNELVSNAINTIYNYAENGYNIGRNIYNNSRNIYNNIRLEYYDNLRRERERFRIVTIPPSSELIHNMGHNPGFIVRYEGIYGNTINLDNIVSTIQNGSINHGLTLETINKYAPIISTCDDFQCIICLNTCRKNENIIRKIDCGHKYCSKCIEKWFEKNNTCPICKCEIKNE